MKQQKILIKNIPALLWGEPSEHCILAVHGKGSHKADTVIQILAEIAANKNYCLLSFDLPQHGNRQLDTTPCDIWHGTADLQAVYDYAKTKYQKISLWACSLGAFFSLVALGNQSVNIVKAFFLSPVVDLQNLTENMMQWADITPEQLQKAGKIPTNFGETLDWEYYTYLKEHPIEKWQTETYILYGEKDNLTPQNVIDNFCRKHGCKLQIMPQGEHFFHTEDQLAVYRNWLKEVL